jgi:hypothetical protein
LKYKKIITAKAKQIIPQTYFGMYEKKSTPKANLIHKAHIENNQRKLINKRVADAPTGSGFSGLSLHSR